MKTYEFILNLRIFTKNLQQQHIHNLKTTNKSQLQNIQGTLFIHSHNVIPLYMSCSCILYFTITLYLLDIVCTFYSLKVSTCLQNQFKKVINKIIFSKITNIARRDTHMR